ncbi:Sulfite reduction-associated complex, DsrM [Desulfatibacillum aliphaticivorans]|uniref:Sulfite reduction-associated complex, DsrM n=1 Tax=Desulfatibacillum aliphaticivorans TaxID=218208 RepID=B8FJN2_DESAL|nr:sulfate reduction electron transfer complex DsrMKJOP subunit DsrM [Desulfatibacillum aliphaticivorans]ACL02310.1 Sulfite reduction-associated complex, DsrM [Desulfatibacillum aliphaticivorans]
MNVWISLIASLIVIGGLVVGAAGVAGLAQYSHTPELLVLLGVVVPLLAFIAFIVGVILQVVKWGRRPVPFPIATVAGQGKSLPWIKASYFDAPYTKAGVVGRMALEVLTFRSLFRNTKMELHDGPKLAYGWQMWLWVFALAFHYAFLTVFIRHFRFFTEDGSLVFQAVMFLENLDGFLQLGLPHVLISGFVLLGAATMLLLRRLTNAQVRYVSLIQDYFPLLLIISIAASGILMRHVIKVDIVAVKALIMSMLNFDFAGIGEKALAVGWMFYLHIFLVSVLLAYFPMSKLMHMGGIFLSPTRNLLCNSREFRHVNPWNYPVKVHTYEHYEDEFRERMIEAGLPVEKTLEETQEAAAPEEKE